MVNFIIYEDEKKYREKYISIILKIVGSMKIAYRIVEISKFDNITYTKIENLIGKKIFILDIEVPGKSGLDLAREIRKKGDWSSPMIIVTTYEQLKNTAFTSKMLMLDFISKYYNFEEQLKESLTLAFDIIEENPSLNFQYNGEVFQIPYDDILFIEKNVDDIYSTIVTINDNIKIKKTIGAISDELEIDKRFFRTHRSCIINTNKLTSLELKEGIMHFGKIENSLLSREKKKELKQLLSKKQSKLYKRKMEEIEC